ncbi:MAG: sodium:proton antiporter, partial [Gammaproteobacteria bacterium]|nr:sodium:proton antiporter [Gammaproteobacteria bacterium]
MHGHEILILCGIIVAGFACQYVAWRVRLPAILFLLVAGLLAGPALGWVDADALFGDLLIPIVSITVALILFEGSLTLKFSELGGHGRVVRNLVTLGVLVTWVAAGLAAHFVLGWDVYLSALFGAIVTVSGPTVVVPLLRSVRPKHSVGSVLKWESILIDPLGAILGLLVFEFVVASQAAEGIRQVVETLVVMVIAGGATGALGGYLFGLALRRRKVPDFLREFGAVAAVLAVFAAAEAVRGESGLLAVTVMGIVIANMRDVEVEDVVGFKESLTLMLVGGLFILLAARLNIDALMSIGVGAVTVILLLQVIAGPLRAMLSSIGSSLNYRERLFLGWVFPRGIVAAAISALFSLRLEANGFENADKLVPLVFAVIIGTVVIQSLSTRTVARLLGVSEPEPTGVLIVGGNSLAIAIGKAISDAGLRVVVADTAWESIRKARMLGLSAWYGSAVSGYADTRLDLTGLGNLLAISRRAGINELACVRYAREFGRDHVFTLADAATERHEKHKVSGEQIGRVLFDGDIQLRDLMVEIARGAEFRTTTLSEEFGLDAFEKMNPGAKMVFAIDPDDRIHFPVSDAPLEPQAGWSV